MDGILVRFGEIGIKSPPVRRHMQARLRQNLLDALLRAGVEGDVQRRGARLWMPGPDTAALLDVATHTFGVVSASACRRVPATIDAVAEVAEPLALARPWDTFAVRARREGTHPFSSQELAVQVGSRIWRAAEAAGRTPSVDLDRPQFELHADVRGDDAYVFTDVVQGPGGLPMGAQGKVVALLSDTASGVAAWMMMRRGAAVIPCYAGDVAGPGPELVHALQRWGFPEDIHVFAVCTGAVQKPTVLAAAADLAGRTRADAIVTGDRLDSDLRAGPIPILRPVCGLDDATFSQLVARIGLPEEEGPDVLVTAGGETLDSLLSMHRQVIV